jgi:hypothetical protein
MLSPNATNCVTESCGGGAAFVTVTVNAHAELRLSASAARQRTLVAPVENAVFDAGVHVVVTGDVPPFTDGGGNVTVTGLPSLDSADMSAGQVTVGGRG